MQIEEVKPEFKSSVFIDLNNNGKMDMVILEEATDSFLYFNVYYNQQSGQSSLTSGELCNNGDEKNPPYITMN